MHFHRRERKERRRFNVNLFKIERIVSHREHRDTESVMQLNYLFSKIIQAAINVHKELGPGLLEAKKLCDSVCSVRHYILKGFGYE